jgi:preprotein translocase subunit SecD
MERSWYFRLTILLGLCGLAIYLLYPSYFFYFRASEEVRDSNVKFCKALPSWAHCSKLNLGLDLQGGVHLVMGVRVDKALEHRADRLADGLRDSLKEKNLPFVRLDRPRDSADIVLELDKAAPPATTEAVEKLLRKEFALLDINRRPGNVLNLSLSTQEADLVRDSAVDQSIKTIRNRADKLGVTEPTIARRGSDQILIQLPGVKDPQHAIDIIGRTAQLEFTMVDTESSEAFAAIKQASLPEGIVKRQSGAGRGNREIYFEMPEAQKGELLALLREHIPEHAVVAFGGVQLSNGLEKPGFLRSYLLQARPGITGDYLENASVQQNRDIPSDYFVTMTFDSEGAKIFEKLTSDHVGQSMAIVLDGKVTSAPTIQEKIGGGTARITLGRSADPHAKFQEAKDLVLVLKAGALPAPVEVREKRQVGKTLGQDTVARGTFAMAVGTALVVVFMALYYRGSGMMANLALLLNVLFMMGFLALIEATLTLPGMAGIVLTIGMAVDANVLIFERIREELRAGKMPRAAIDSGYKKAFATIFDSNVTTMIAGVVLMQYGSGPVRGFAVTLIIGLTCSLYTAIVVTRLIYDALTANRQLTTLSI